MHKQRDLGPWVMGQLCSPHVSLWRLIGSPSQRFSNRLSEVEISLTVQKGGSDGLPKEVFLKSKHFPSSDQPPSEKVSFSGEPPNGPQTLSLEAKQQQKGENSTKLLKTNQSYTKKQTKNHVSRGGQRIAKWRGVEGESQGPRTVVPGAMGLH